MGNKKLKTMLHSPLQFDILNIESEKKELSLQQGAPQGAPSAFWERKRQRAGLVAELPRLPWGNG
jgi:hypothetical protein